jgi:hypothetical protein
MEAVKAKRKESEEIPFSKPSSAIISHPSRTPNPAAVY